MARGIVVLIGAAVWYTGLKVINYGFTGHWDIIWTWTSFFLFLGGSLVMSLGRGFMNYDDEEN